MRVRFFTDGSCSGSNSYQLLFQGEILAGKDSIDAGRKWLGNWKSLVGMIDRIRPGQFTVLAQDLDFELAKRHMKKLVSMGIITYIEPMRIVPAKTKSLI